MGNAYPELVEALADQGRPRFVADGEIVAFDGAETLDFLARQGTLEFHIWLSTVDRPDRPVLDLDPPNAHFSVLPAAFRSATKAA